MTRLVHIIDDDGPFRTAIDRLLRAHSYTTVEHVSAEHFLVYFGDGNADGCILLDVRMPGLSGPELQARLAERGIAFPIVFLTGHGDVPSSVRAIKAGAEDFLEKPILGPDLVCAIERAFARLEASRTALEWRRGATALLAGLTPREREVFDHVVRGRLNKQTARALGITVRTIKAHRQRVFDKLDARSVAELVSFAERLGLLAD